MGRNFFNGEVSLMEQIFPLPDEDERRRMAEGIREVEELALEIMPLENFRPWEQIVEEPIEAPRFRCKWEGCDTVVNTGKGVGGYCTKLQPNDKTHRQMHIEKMREIDPGYLRKENTGNSNRGKQENGRVTTPRYSAREVATLERKAGTFWLDDVEGMIAAAALRVREAQENLSEAKSELKRILTEAAERVE